MTVANMNSRKHVRVKAFPLVMSDGTFYLGESMVELSVRGRNGIGDHVTGSVQVALGDR